MQHGEIEIRYVIYVDYAFIYCKEMPENCLVSLLRSSPSFQTLTLVIFSKFLKVDVYSNNLCMHV